MSIELKHLLSIPEKRHYQRLDIHLDVAIEFDGKKLEATASNISCGGMFLPDFASQITVESDLVVFLNLPDHTQPIRLPARVRRVETQLQSKKIAVALEFNRLYDDGRLRIDRFVKWKRLN